jgi:H/ACA ribonucleoprotein complex subunit 4
MLIKFEEAVIEFGKRPEERSLEELIKKSVVIVDKNTGPTSHQVSLWVKDIFKVKKAGHSGTLV